MNNEAMILLLVLATCHWVADFGWLSTPTMRDAKSRGSPSFPILHHALVHTGLMGLCLGILGYKVGSNGFDAMHALQLQLISHFCIDTLKGKMNIWFPEVKNPATNVHWSLFGFDQLLHFIVIVIMVKMIVA